MLRGTRYDINDISRPEKHVILAAFVSSLVFVVPTAAASGLSFGENGVGAVTTKGVVPVVLGKG
jgi:hypothetical protein